MSVLRRFAVGVLLASTFAGGACAPESPSNPDAGPPVDVSGGDASVTESAVTSTPVAVPLFEFVGYADPSTNDLRIEVVDAHPVVEGVLRTVSQATWCSPVIVQDGVEYSSPPNSLEPFTDPDTVASSVPGEPYPAECRIPEFDADRSEYDDLYIIDGVFCGVTGLRNFYEEAFDNIHIEILYVGSPDNAPYTYPYGNGAEWESLPGRDAPGVSNGGLFRVGDLAPQGDAGDENTTMLTFKNGSDAPFEFRGVVYAETAEDCDTPIDDDCDGVVNNGCRLFEGGDPCYDGEDCETGVCTDGECVGACAPGRFGADCAECPGGADTPCSDNGSCDEGLDGDGACTCDEGFVGDACDACVDNRFGADCAECPGGVDDPCSGLGVCNDGIGGTGLCDCDAGRGGDACEECAAGFFGADCERCPGPAGSPCNGNGACSEGVDGDGSCVCAAGAHGIACENTCEDGVQNGDEDGIDCGGPCAFSCDDAFTVTAWSDVGCSIRDVNPWSGDDRGGLVMNSTSVFYRGDSGTARIAAGDLSGGTRVASLDALFWDLETGTTYTLANGTSALGYGGGTVNTIYPLNESLAVQTGDCVDLDTPIAVGGGTGIFSGYGKLMLYYNQTWWEIDVATGEVDRLATGQSIGAYAGCESWAFWGIAESGEPRSVLYVQNSTTVSRYTINDGASLFRAFTNLGDACSITYDPVRERVYFKYESGGQFGSAAQAVGYCPGEHTEGPQCNVGYFGPDCDPCPESGGEICGGHGTCDEGRRGAGTCACQRGFHGDTCEFSCYDGVQNGDETSVDEGPSCIGEDLFIVEDMTGDNCRSVNHDAYSGDDRGGIAMNFESTPYVYYTGDSRTVRVNAADVAAGSRTSMPYRREAMFWDLSTGETWTLAYNTSPITGSATVNAICRMAPNNLAVTTCRNLSTSIPVNSAGIFSGYGHLIVFTSTGNTWYDIDIASGTVTTITSGVGLTRNGCETWATWGVAEREGESRSVIYAYSNRLDRLDLDDARVQTVRSFPSIGDMCSVTYAPEVSRWYFHSEASVSFVGGTEILAYCDGEHAAGTDCLPGLFGDDCTPCPGGAEDPCNARGVCADGLAGDGTCACDDGYHGSACEFSCFDGDQNGDETGVDAGPSCRGRETFVIDSIGDTGCNAVDVNATSGDDYGGIALGGDNLFYVGDSQTVRVGASTLSPANGMTRRPGVFADLANNALYTFTRDGGAIPGAGIVDGICRMDDDTLEMSTDCVDLASSLNLPNGSGVFSGRGEVVVYNPSGNVWYGIDPVDGSVETLATGRAINRNNCEGWAFYGIAEYDDDGYRSVVYAYANRIDRLSLDTGSVETLRSFPSLSDMCSITFDHDAERWFWHHEGSSSLASGNEMLGYCDASSTVSGGCLDGFYGFGCAPCPGGAADPCSGNGVCDDGISGTGVCACASGYHGPACDLSCYDGVQNGEETAIDDGGPCRGAFEFTVTDMGFENCRAIDPVSVTGDDRGGMAISETSVFYNGDSGTGRFSASDLSGGVRVPTRREALFSDLSTRTVYTLAYNNAPRTGAGTVNSFCELDTNLNLVAGSCTAMDTAVNLSGSVGIYSGYEEVVLYTNGNWYAVNVESGEVDAFASGATPPALYGCENWAHWGVAERGARRSILYSRSSGTGRVARYWPVDRTYEEITTVENVIGDMCTFTVDPVRDRWFFLFEGNNPRFPGGGSESLVSCDIEAGAGFACIDGRWGADCELCPGEPGTPCNERGTCSDGVSGDGTCACDFGFHGAACQFSCSDEEQNGDETAVDAGGPCVAPEGLEILDLGVSECRIVDVNSTAGDDYGGLALSTSGDDAWVYTTGDSGTARAGASDLSSPTRMANRRVGTFWDLEDGTLYTLAYGAGTPITGPTTITSFCPLDPDTLAVSGPCTTLSSNLAIGTPAGVFSGYGQLIVYSQSGYRWYHIDLEDGEVTIVNQGVNFARSSCEGWATYGIAEGSPGDLRVLYIYANQVIRRHLDDNATEVVQRFTNIGDACAITYDVEGSSWYFTYEGAAQFGGSAETLGVCGGDHRVVGGCDPGRFGLGCAECPGGADTPCSENGVCDEGSAGSGTCECDLGFHGTACEFSCYDGVQNGDETGIDTGAICRGERLTGVTDLTADNCRVIDHNAITGDDRGGLAVGSDHVWYTGDSGTGRFATSDLSGGVRQASRYAMFSDTQTGDVYTLAYNGSPYGGGGTVNQICGLNPANLAVQDCVALSTSIYLSSTTGIFSGPGRVTVNYGGTWWTIDVSDGTVEQVATGRTPPNIQGCETWAYWGIDEGGEIPSVVYVRAIGNRQIGRYNVGDGSVERVGTIDNLSDMCSIGIHVDLERWYFQHEGSSRFGSFSEAIGYCDAVLVDGFDCLPGTFGEDCEQCPGGGADPCNGDGVCDDGLGGEGTCACDFGFHGDACQFSCFDDVQNGDETGVDSGPSCTAEPGFSVVSVDDTACEIMDVNAWSGDDRGGLAMQTRGATDYLYYTGDSGTARVTANLDGSGRRVARRDAMFWDMESGRLYTLAYSGSIPLTSGRTTTHFCELDPDTLAVSTPCTALSTALPLTSNTGIFSGYGELIVYTSSGNRWYAVDLSDGTVEELRSGLGFSRPGCETWGATWGIAEGSGSNRSVLYPNANALRRMTISSGLQEVVHQFSNLGDMCSITWEPERDRWYFHYEGAAQFGGSSETVGYCGGSSTVFDECEPGFYGIGCAACPGTAADPCGPQGECNDGVAGDGVCDCELGYHGTTCEFTCYDGVQNGAETGIDIGPPCVGEDEFVVESMSTGSCDIVQHSAYSGDDRGGVAMSRSGDTTNFFYTGDSRTARVNADGVTSPTSTPYRRDALLWDLDEGTVYSLANGTSPIGQGGTVNAICELDPTTLATTGRCTALSRSISMSSSSGIFSGHGHAILLQWSGGIWWDVDYETGEVTEIASGRNPAIQGCENWARWGIAERSGDDRTVLYVYNGWVVRYDPVENTATNTFNITSPSDMCSITIDPELERWYWHAEGRPSWAPAAGGDEFMGSCPAEVSASGGCLPGYYGELCEGACPGGAATPCNGRGTCDDGTSGDGTCACADGFHGDACEFTCVDGVQNGTETGIDSGPDCVGIETFRITDLSQSSCASVDVFATISDDWGGIAMSGDAVYSLGDAATAKVGADSLSPVERIDTRQFTMFWDLDSRQIYALADGLGPLTSPTTATRFCPLDPDTLEVDGSCTALSTSIPVPSGSALYSGWGHLIILSNSGYNWHVVDLRDGDVQTIRSSWNIARQYCEGWYQSGIAEYDGTNYSVVYAYSGRTYRAVPATRSVTTLRSYSGGTSDMCSITFDAERDRWYFSHEYSSGLGSGNEVVGYCDATADIDTGCEPFEYGLGCAPCPGGVDDPCTGNGICNDGIGGDGVCACEVGFHGNACQFSCYDGVQNGAETGIDVGTPCLGDPIDGLLDLTDEDCEFVEVSATTGDDFAGMVATNSNVYAVGDSGTGRFAAADLSPGGRVTRRPAMFVDYATDEVWTLAIGATPYNAGSGTLTSICRLDPTTLNPTGVCRALSRSIYVSSYTGIFSGEGQVLVNYGSTWYRITIADGTVETAASGRSLPSIRPCENANVFNGFIDPGNEDLVVYATSDGFRVRRYDISSGSSERMGTFTNLGDMCGIALDSDRLRWYGWGEGGNQFGSYAEFLGYCTALVADDGNECLPGRWGVDCELCPGGGADPCGGRGTCDDGYFGDGTCACELGFHGDACEFSCYDDVQNGDETAVDAGGPCRQPSGLRIDTLTASSCSTVDMNAWSGDHRSGIALHTSGATDRFFVGGDSGVGRVDLPGLGSGRRVASIRDNMLWDLESGDTYVFSVNGGFMSTGNANRICRVNPDNFAITDCQTLSSTVYLASSAGIFSGYGHAVVYSPSGSTWLSVEYETGEVTTITNGFGYNGRGCEGYGVRYGIAEGGVGDWSVIYPRDTQRIERLDLQSREVETVSTFTNLGDMCQITYEPDTERWYFHHEGSSQFGAGAEVGGYCGGTHTVVEECEDGFFGLGCAACPGDAGSICNDHGTCDDGTNGTGECACDLGFHGAACEFDCYDGVQNGEETGIDEGDVCTGDPVFRMNSFSTASCDVVSHASQSGDDRGGIAMSYDGATTYVFYNGDSRVARMNTEPVRTPTPMASRQDGIFWDLETGTPYALMNGASQITGATTVTRYCALNPTTFAVTGDCTDLSRSVSFVGSSYNGVFSGYGHLILWSESGYNWYDVDLATGEVTQIATNRRPNIYGCENWAIWGIAEREGSSRTVIYRYSNNLYRYDPNTGVATSVASLGSASDMCSLTYDPRGERWYYHAEGATSFSSGVSNEIVGSCPAAHTAGSDCLTGQWGADCEPCLGGAATPCNDNGTCDDGLDGTGLCECEAGFHGLACQFSCSDGVQNGSETGIDAGPDCLGTAGFNIDSLTADNCRVVDHNSVTGDDRGGIAMSTSGATDYVYYSGDSRTGRFLASNLSGGAGMSYVRDNMFWDLQTGRVYSLGSGNSILGGTGTRNTICEMNPSNLATLGACRPLSSSITVQSGMGWFSGYGELILYTPSGNTWYAVDIATGSVETLRAGLGLSAQACENYSARWGVAEGDGASRSVVYRGSGQIIQRLTIASGVVETVQSFTNLSDMCSITYDPASERWYFHHEGGSQFGGSAETIGYCDGTHTVEDDCDPGRYGLGCAACPGGAADPCNGNGTCDDGVGGLGTCECDRGAHGTACEFTCSDGVQNGDETAIDEGGSCAASEGHFVFLGADWYDANATWRRLLRNAMLLADTDGTIRTLAYTEYADLSREKPRTDADITSELTSAGRAWTRTDVADRSVVAATLDRDRYDVFLVYEQERNRGGGTSVAAAYRAAAQTFLEEGGVIIVLDSAEYANGMGLLNYSSLTHSSYTSTVLAPADPVADGVGSVPYSNSTRFVLNPTAGAFAPDAFTIVARYSTTYVPVIHATYEGAGGGGGGGDAARTGGFGLFIGHDFGSADASMRTVLGNAVAQADTDDPIQVLAYTGSTDADDELVDTRAALTAAMAAEGRAYSLTEVTSPGIVEAALDRDLFDVFIVFEQEDAPTATTAEAWADAAETFLAQDGIIIVMHDVAWATSIGLFDGTTSTTFSSGSATIDAPADVLLDGVAALATPNSTGSVTALADGTIETDTRTVLASRGGSAVLVKMVVPEGAGALSFEGVRTNVAIADLGGWEQCFSETYNRSGTSLASVASACAGSHLMLACRRTGTDTLIVAAHAPREDVLFDTDESNTPHNANGVGWYWGRNESWGFAPQGRSIGRNSCDTATDGGTENRLCWHTGSSNLNGGWSCGSNRSLNSSSAYERLVYTADL